MAGRGRQCGKKAHRAHEKCIFEFNRKINNNWGRAMWRMGDFFSRANALSRKVCNNKFRRDARSFVCFTTAASKKNREAA